LAARWSNCDEIRLRRSASNSQGPETLADLTANLESRARAGTAEKAALPVTSRGYDVVDVGPQAVPARHAGMRGSIE
jgi:hypothetical protein